MDQGRLAGPGFDPGGLSGRELWEAVREHCRGAGLLDRQITVEHGGHTFRIACAEHSFLVYRVNAHHSLPPGAPGWPVCLVDEGRFFQECEAAGLGPQDLACAMTLSDWLALAGECVAHAGTVKDPADR